MVSTDFILDHVKSIDMGIYVVKVNNSGMNATPYVGAKGVVSDKVPRRDIAYCYGVEKTPIKFSVTFSLLDEEMTDEKKMELARWLFQDEYREFTSLDNLNKHYYVIATNQIDFMTTDNKLGYFDVDFETNAPYAWSSSFLDTFNVNVGNVIEIANKSNVGKIYKPEIEFKLLNTSTSFSMRNLSNGGSVFAFTGLNQGETIYVNNDMKQVISDNEIFPYRLGNFNKQWCELVYGINRLEILEGTARLSFRMKFPLYV